jgi:hypothetical protein
MDRTREELREAGDHAKRALLATLKAARSALDAAIDRLDDERPSGEHAVDGGPADGAPPPNDGHGP